ncbi:MULTISPECIES: dihydrofolate reductase family protein [unclassified Sphingobacterium]|uniref:dihydrofolate reductase family protein n=1 Tax=unclassified Sphingobacterium TaxID=2609468 RepID=UPI00295434D8|nr:dihydrofolate reductase family protein [Sphingobacterium sp. UGAL515B_05]WON93188.1 dihydrofolate reductase family protein [Sphingobacterium sp. UGAL515B_05]
MRKVIAAFNMTLDGFCDHTAGIPNAEIHTHYTDLLNGGDVILYGRITYQLMEYWRSFVKTPVGEKSMDDFASAIDKIPKLVFSNSLKNIEWESAKLANGALEDEILKLKLQSGSNILVGSRSLIIQLLNLNLIDEFQLCIYPIVFGRGLPLFEEIDDRIIFKLVKTKVFTNGSVLLYYRPIHP